MMRLLLDECVPHDFKKDLGPHDAATVEEAGYKGMTNGALLQAASESFDALITVDRNLPHQQNISSFPIALIVINAGGITYDHLKAVAQQVLAALNHAKAGEVVNVTKQ